MHPNPGDHDSIGNIVSANKLENPSAHCNNCGFSGPKCIANSSAAI